jgi:transposase InsO family protein
MMEYDLPSFPWEILGSDLFDFEGHKYLIVADYFSKFFIIRKLTSETSGTIIKQLKTIFSEHGVPSELFTDNGPCYSSDEFKQFAAT